MEEPVPDVMKQDAHFPSESTLWKPAGGGTLVIIIVPQHFILF